jgi:hypothetical protein
MTAAAGGTGGLGATGDAPAGASTRTPPLPQLLSELWELIVTYVRQQTLDPIKRLGRYVGFGLLGALLLGFGVVFLALAGLRALQTETGSTFEGDWSWAPYLIVVGGLAIGGGLTWTARRRRAWKETR